MGFGPNSASPETDDKAAGLDGFQQYALLAASLTIVLGVVVLLGWILDFRPFTSVLPDYRPMRPNTALALVLAGITLLLLRPTARSRTRTLLGRVGAVGIAAVGLLSLLEFTRLAPSQWTRLSPLTDPDLIPPHVSLNASASLVMLSMALLLMDDPVRRRVRPGDLLTMTVGFFALVTCAGYLYGAQPFVGIPGRVPYTAMSLHTAISLLVLASGVLAARPRRGIMAVVSSSHAGGYMARRLLLGALIIPLMGFLVTVGASLGFYSSLFGASLLAGLAMLVAVALTVVTARTLNDSDKARQQALSLLEEDNLRRQRAEEQLRSAEAKYRGLVESAQDLILLIDGQGRIEFANRRLEPLFGYTPPEVIGHPLEKLIPSRGEISTLRSRGQGLELIATRKDGTEFPVNLSLSSSRSHDGAPSLVTAILHDMSFRHRAELQQRFLAQLGELLAESLDPHPTLEKVVRRAVPELADWCVIGLFDASRRSFKGAVAHRDPHKQSAAEALLGLPPSRLEAVPGVLSSRTTPLLLRNLGPEWFETEVPDEELRGRLSELGLRSFIVIPLRAQSQPLGTLTLVASYRNFSRHDLAFAEEVGRRVALFAENARLYQRAQEAIQTREDVLAIVSHDLRTPLNTQRLAVELITGRVLPELPPGSALTQRLRRILLTMKRSSDQANRLISDLLDFAKSESGTLRITPRQESAEELLEASWALLKPSADEAAIRLEYFVEEGLTPWCDRDRVLQVLSNLVGNAIKFGFVGGQVEVHAQRGPEGMALFSVEDDGPGISEEDAARVFDRYWQPEQSQKRGTGLGLAIARHLVEAHGGRIWLTTRAGLGSRFFFTLPLAPRPSVQPETHP